MTIRIVTDSVADIPKEVAEELEISVVPLYVHFGTESFRDNVDIEPDEFYRRLAEGPIHPTTSSGPIGDFLQIWQNLLDQGADKIISIHASKKLSAVYGTALQAQEMIGEKEKDKIEIIDSALGVMAMGFPVMIAARLAKQGKNTEQILAAVDKGISHVSLLAVIEDIKYLKKGGRALKPVIKAIELALKTFKRKSLITLKNGEVSLFGTRFIKPYDKTRKMLEFVQKHPGIEEIALEYAPDLKGETEKIVQELSNEIKSLLPDIPFYFTQISPVIGVHAGPGAIVISLITKAES